MSFDQMKAMSGPKTFKHQLVDLPKLKRIDGTPRLYQTPEGFQYPSMTSVLKHLSADAIEKWRKRVGEEEANRISEQASIRGNHIHELAEFYLRNLHHRLKEKPKKYQNQFKKMRKYINRIDNILAIEGSLYSDKLAIAGSADCIAEFDGELAVIDFKTSLKLKREDWILSYFLQATGYSLMFEELTGIVCEKLVVIIMVDGKPTQVFVKDRKPYIALLRVTVANYYQNYWRTNV